MKAIKIHEYGGPEKLQYEDTPIPEIGDNQILVKVYATSVNHLEVKKASGSSKKIMPLNFPWVPGFDFSGIIEKTGKSVKNFNIGDKVYGNCNGGSYAEYLAADISKVVKMPENLTFAEASSVPHVGETAWQALFKHGQLKKGETVLIHGAAGAVGAFAVQFAHSIGAKVLTNVSGSDFDYVKKIGADEMVDYKTQDFSEVYKNVDLVILLVGGDTEKKSYAVLKEGGRIVSTVGIANPDIAKEKRITAIPMVIEQSGKDLEEISKLIKDGKVKTDVAVTYPLEKAAIGWKTLLGSDPSIPRITHGKIVLEIKK